MELLNYAHLISARTHLWTDDKVESLSQSQKSDFDALVMSSPSENMKRWPAVHAVCMTAALKAAEQDASVALEYARMGTSLITRNLKQNDIRSTLHDSAVLHRSHLVEIAVTLFAASNLCAVRAAIQLIGETVPSDAHKVDQLAEARCRGTLVPTESINSISESLDTLEQEPARGAPSNTARRQHVENLAKAEGMSFENPAKAVEYARLAVAAWSRFDDRLRTSWKHFHQSQVGLIAWRLQDNEHTSEALEVLRLLRSEQPSSSLA